MISIRTTSIILLALLSGLVSNSHCASIANATITDDGTVFRTNQDLDSFGTLDWEIYESTSLNSLNRRSGPLDRIAFGASLGNATLEANAKVNTSFDYTTGVSPSTSTGQNTADLRMLAADFSANDFYTLSFTAASASPHVVTLWGNRRVGNVRMTASLPGAADVVTELIGGGSDTETAWYYQVTFTPNQADDVFDLKIQGLAVSGGKSERLGINAAALEGVGIPQSLFVDVLFQDNMVLQRDMETPVWGMADPGANVTLTLDGATVIGSTVADGSGKWLARIGPQAHDGGVAHTLVISSPGQISVTLDNVVFGDVYLASGQSNMYRVVNSSNILNATAEIAAANYPLIRQIEIGEISSPVPVEDPQINQGWTPCSPGSVTNFSATGYFYARDVHVATGVPVGLLFAARGAREISHFMAPEGYALIPELAGMRQDLEQNPDPEYFDLYNGMIAPLVPYGLKGAIWYQGEWDASGDDTDRRTYHQKMRALIGGWRYLWDQGDFPVYYVQLQNVGNGTNYARVREAQFDTLTEDHVGMAVTFESSAIGTEDPLHPLNKQEVGYRLARWALADIYGLDVVPSGPLFQSASIEGSSIRIAFDYVGDGLMVASKNGRMNPVIPTTGPLENFEIAGANQTFFPADAVIDSGTVAVSSASVPSPVYVRYCYTNTPTGATFLYNTDKLPASPFRTDKVHGLTVASGGGDGDYPAGANVTVTADAAPSGSVFDRWIGLASGIANPNAVSTTVTMPARGVYLKATYRPSAAASYAVAVAQGAGGGTSQAGAYVTVEADPAATGWIFDQWTGGTASLQNAFAAHTTLTMPASAVTLQAVYRLLDSVGDGIPDLWRAANFPPGDGSTATVSSQYDADPDGDKRDNLLEYIEGSDPNVADTGPRLEIVFDGIDLRVQFNATAASGPGYQGMTRWFSLLETPDLATGSWQHVPGYGDVAGANQPVSHTLDSPPAKGFFQLQIDLE